MLAPLKAQAAASLAAHPALLVGLGVPDDAAVYRLTDEVALIQTVDFFTPIVDDPREFGAIAAANSLSDVYAMGGEPLLALNIGGFPASLPHAMITEIFIGADEVVRAAGAVTAGGHTIIDEEPKFGLVVTGTVHPAGIVAVAGIQPGDHLFLTKPLGTGLVTTAARNDSLTDPAHLAAAVASMRRLNRAAAAAMRAVGIGPEGVHAATDVTGFGLLGHAVEMAEASDLALHLDAAALPLLPGAREYAEAGQSPGGAGRNRAHFAPQVRLDDERVDRALAALLWDPQTSGGLLIAVAEAAAPRLAAELAAHDLPVHRIGHAAPGRGVTVT